MSSTARTQLWSSRLICLASTLEYVPYIVVYVVYHNDNLYSNQCQNNVERERTVSADHLVDQAISQEETRSGAG